MYIVAAESEASAVLRGRVLRALVVRIVEQAGQVSVQVSPATGAVHARVAVVVPMSVALNPLTILRSMSIAS